MLPYSSFITARTCSALVRYCTNFKRKQVENVSRRRSNATCVLKKEKSSLLPNELNYRKLTFGRTVETFFCFEQIDTSDLLLSSLFNVVTICAPHPEKQNFFFLEPISLINLACSYSLLKCLLNRI